MRWCPCTAPTANAIGAAGESPLAIAPRFRDLPLRYDVEFLSEALVKAGEVLALLKADYDLGRGHGMALVHVIKQGPQIDAKHVGGTVAWPPGTIRLTRTFRVSAPSPGI